jgi:hypothetical protein
MPADKIHTRHERTFETNRFVYPVISRRSGGLSIGVNLNPDKICNFDCIYCQVDRRIQGLTRFVELPALLTELEQTLASASSGRLFEHPDFADVPARLRQLIDIAFSGDGEPTSHRNFDQVVAKCAEVKQRMGLDSVKMVLITNASLLHRAHVQRGLEVMDANQGEIWAKLDAGSEAYFRTVERTPITLGRILEEHHPNSPRSATGDSIPVHADRRRGTGHGGIGGVLPAAERDRGVRRPVELVQICTVARRPAESYVTPLSDAEVDRIVNWWWNVQG